MVPRSHSPLRTYANRLTLALGALAMTFSPGCFRHTEVVTSMPNPIRSGGVTPNEIPVLQTNVERRHQIPAGSLADVAQLTQLDAGQACFRVTLRAMESGASGGWTDHGAWGISMLVGDGIEVVEPHVIVGERARQSYNGRVQQRVQTGQEQVCVDGDGNVRNPDSVTRDNPCGRWESRPVYDTQWVPARIHVISSTGDICFQHQGHVNASTPAITLKMQRQRRRLDFTWEFH